MPRPRHSTAGFLQKRIAIHRNSPVFAVAALALGLAGCSSLGLPPGERLDRTAVGSIRAATPVSATKSPPVAASDWETIRQTIPNALSRNGVSDWKNPETGSSGTITL